MATNEIPRGYDPIVELLEDAADGAHSHGALVGLKQNDETALRAVLEALVGTPAGPGNVPPAVPGLKALWNVAKADKAAKAAAFRVTKSNARAVATACVNVLKARLGRDWNNAWQLAGFTGGSLAIPDNPLTLLQQLRAYFAANPAHEIPNIADGLSATAEMCQTVVNWISDASSASNASNSAAGEAKDALERKLRDARTRLTGLREELAQLLGPDDERWYIFGFDRPNDPRTPEVPENVTATPGAAGSGDLFVDFDDARRAEKYRVRLSNAGSGAEVAARLVAESEAMLSDLPLGTALKIEVTALNDAGESQPSEPVTVTLA